MQLLFIFFLLGSLYSFVIYPGVLFFLPKRKVKYSQTSAGRHTISVIIAAHNEERRIEEKIESTLKAINALEGAQCIVVSDASTDSTDSIIQSFSSRGVEYVRQSQREGKEAAQLKGLSIATGDIVFFTDVATKVRGESVRAALGCFKDADVGAVSSRDCFESDKKSGEGLYVRYEMALRRMESDRGGLIGLSGSFFAVRRELCTPWRTDIPSDFAIALNCYANRKVAVHCNEMVGEYKDLADHKAEFQRKKRTILRGMAAFTNGWHLLSFKNGAKFGFQVWSHKVLRWTTPWHLLGLFITGLLCFEQSALISFVLLTQAGFGSLAVMGWLIPQLNRFTLIRIPTYFAKVNIAMAGALVEFLKGKRVIVWDPSKR